MRQQLALLQSSQQPSRSFPSTILQTEGIKRGLAAHKIAKTIGSLDSNDALRLEIALKQIKVSSDALKLASEKLKDLPTHHQPIAGIDKYITVLKDTIMGLVEFVTKAEKERKEHCPYSLEWYYGYLEPLMAKEMVKLERKDVQKG